MVLQNVGGGGRYDEMIGKFTGTPTPATGFSIRYDELLSYFMEKGFQVPGAKAKKAYLLDKNLQASPGHEKSRRGKKRRTEYKYCICKEE